MAAEHPFARFVAALGRGPRKSRDLSEEEAFEAMRLVLAGEVEPVQLGAFLMLMRYKAETPAELAGFVRALRAGLDRPAADARVDLDWPSYADRHKQVPWFVLAALLVAESGVKVLMHGIDGAAGDGFVTTRAALSALGIGPSRSLPAAADGLRGANLAYVGIEALSPAAARLFALRPLLGLRSPINSVARALNPLDAPHQLQGVFHPPYVRLHQEAALRLGQPAAAIFKGGGGEGQRNPDKPCTVATVADGTPAEETWPALRPGEAYPWRDEERDARRIAALWRGDLAAPAPKAAVTGTAALALRLLGRAPDMDRAQAMAEDLWRARPRGKYGAPAPAAASAA